MQWTDTAAGVAKSNHRMDQHVRNVVSMLASPRCGARTRSRMPCKSPAVRGKRRCRMHGGKGSGAPRGNTNALRYGTFRKKAIERRKILRELIKNAEKLVRAIDQST